MAESKDGYQPEAQWFRDAIGVGTPHDDGQTMHWLFAPQPNGDTVLLLGVDDGRYMTWRMDGQHWEQVKAAGDAVIYRNNPPKRGRRWIVGGGGGAAGSGSGATNAGGLQ